MLSSTRAFQIGPHAVLVEADEPVVLAHFEALFSGFEDAPAEHPDTILRIERVQRQSSEQHGPTEATLHRDRRYRATLGDKQVGGASNLEQLSLAVTRKLNRSVLDAEPEVLHLHAGAVRNDEAVLLIIGTSFAGKSTLVAKLVTEGWRYLSDEQVGIGRHGELLAFPRPITLRRDSWPLFAELGLADSARASPDRVEVSPTAFGIVDRSDPATPTLVICPDASSDTFGVERLTTAETLALFVSDSMDLERAGDAGRDAMLALAESAPGYRISGRDLDQKVRAIAELAATAKSPGPAREHEIATPDEPGVRVNGTQGWLFADGSSALYEPVSGALVRLDEAGFRTWQLFATAPSDWPNGAAASDFMRDLVQAGLLGSGET